MKQLPQSRVTFALVLVSILILPIIFLYPFHADIDIQQVMGFELARFHGLPYLASWDSNFPGTILIHATAIELFGDSEFALRLTDWLFQIGSIILLYRIGRYWLDRTPALLGAMLYALFYTIGPGQYISQRDCFAILPILLSIWATLAAFRNTNPSRRTLAIYAAGIFVGMATSIRPTFGLLLLPVLAFLDVRSLAGRRELLFELLGFGSVIVLGLIPFALTLGGLHALYFATIRYNVDVYSHVFSFRDYSRRVWVAAAFLSLWILAVLNHRRKGMVSLYKPVSTKEIHYLIALFAALLVGVAIMRRLASYHFAPFFACFMPVLAAVIWENLLVPIRPRAIRSAVILAILVVIYPWYMVEPFLSNLFHQRLSFSAAIRCAEDDSNNRSIAAYIEHNSKPSDVVELATFTAPGPRWRINRPVGTRFTTIQCLLTPQPDNTYTPYQKVWQEEYVDSLRSKRPKFYIIDNPPVLHNEPTTLELLYKLPGLKQWLQEDYRSDTTIGNYLLFEHIPSS